MATKKVRGKGRYSGNTNPLLQDETGKVEQPKSNVKGKVELKFAVPKKRTTEKSHWENHPDHLTPEQLAKQREQIKKIKFEPVPELARPNETKEINIHPLQKYVLENYKNVSKLKTQLTFENFYLKHLIENNDKIQELIDDKHLTDLRKIAIDGALRMIDQRAYSTMKLITGDHIVKSAIPIYEFLKNGK